MASTQNLYQCRLCLKRTPTRVNIFGGDFPKMLEILTSIKVRENDGLPKYSCVQCAIDVKTALITKKRIVKAHNYLTEALKKKTVASTSKQRLPVQPQSARKPVVKPSKDAIRIETIPKKYPEVSIKKICNDSQNNADTSLNITPKIEVIKIEVSDEDTQNSNDPTEFDISKKIEFKGKFTVTATDFDISENIDDFDISKKIEDKKKCTVAATKFDISKKIGNRQKSTVTEPEFDISKKIEDKDNLTCKVCNTTFTDRYSYTLHCGKHKKTKCNICNKSIRTDNFKKHLLVHSSGPSVCSLCGSTCKNEVSLASHIFYQHRNVDAWVCEECGAKFNSRYKFFLHKRKAHGGTRHIKCETCGKSFFTKRCLLNHDRRIHQKLRPYVCEFCGTGYSSQYALKTHKRQHTNEKPFVCDHCDEGFRQRVSLRNHLKSKHGIEEPKESICPDCGKGFGTDYALSIHRRLHGSMKCEVCSESFAGQDYLNNHLKEAHGIVDEVENDTEEDTEENHEES